MKLRSIAGAGLGVIVLAAGCHHSPSDTDSSSGASLVSPGPTNLAPTPAVDAALGAAQGSKVVRRVDTVSDLTFTDGSHVHLISPSSSLPCDNRVELPAARKLLVGQRVTADNEYGSFSEIKLPDGTDYAAALYNATTQQVAERCYGAGSSSASASASGSGVGLPYIPLPRHDSHVSVGGHHVHVHL